MIEVDNLTRFYGDKAAIRDLNFRVGKGEILGMLGPNGAGKTTTMKILTCFLPASEGTARVAGYDVFHDSMEVKKRIGYLPESPPLYLEMTVQDYLDFVAEIKRVSRNEKKLSIDRAIEKCGIGDVRRRTIGKLSKGYRQRVGLAQAILHNPEVLILDEPTIGLDPRQIIEVRSLIKGLGGDHTIILSTHILPEVSMTCGRVVIINEGKVVAEDTPDTLTSKLRGAEKILIEVEGNPGEITNAIKSVPGVLKVTREREINHRIQWTVESEANQDVRKELAKMLIQKKFGLYELRSVGMSLEEIFLKLTTKEDIEA